MSFVAMQENLFGFGSTFFMLRVIKPNLIYPLMNVSRMKQINNYEDV